MLSVPTTAPDAADLSELISWCCSTLWPYADVIDIPTLAMFLLDLESPLEVRNILHLYLGEDKEITEFADQFLEIRSKYKTQPNVAITEETVPAEKPPNDVPEAMEEGLDICYGYSDTTIRDHLNDFDDRDNGKKAR